MKTWTNDIHQIVTILNQKLKIDPNSWHKDKGNKNIRAAELISSALCQLIIGNNIDQSIAYLEESIKWLKGINVDKPCPHKKSSL